MNGVYELPGLVNVYIRNWEESTMLLMGKSTISTGLFSIAMFVYQMVNPMLCPISVGFETSSVVGF